MTISDVKATESAELNTENKNLVSYKTKLGSQECKVEYSFLNEKLFSAKYLIHVHYYNPDLYIKDFMTYSDYLKQKYGTPKLYSEEWIDNTAVKNREVWGNSIINGDLYLRSQWATATTNIELLLTRASDGLIYIIIEYSPVTSKPLTKEEISKIIEDL